MKVLGVLLILIAMVLGIVSDSINPFNKEPVIVLAFLFCIVGIYILIVENKIDELTSPKKCICNDIEKHSPGGRCEAHDFGIKIPQMPADRIERMP